MDGSNHDLLRPDIHRATDVVSHSKSTWNALLSSAQSATALPHPCSNIKALLNKTPSIPEPVDAADCFGTNSLYIEGYATWSVSPVDRSSACGLPPRKKTGSRTVYIGGMERVYPLLNPVSNYLGIFVLGWSYILSARLIEIRRKAQWDCHIQSQTDGPLPDNSYIIDIGTHDLAEVRWWAAILAEGRGWQATLVRDGKEYYPLWECHLNSSQFRLHHCPPSSTQAQEYLFNLARYHDAFDQLISALAATMTIPLHNRFGARITLPLPKPGRLPIAHRKTELTYRNQIPIPDEIPHYMAVSCTSGVVTSCLFSCFWEPDIPCNLVSQWLNLSMRQIFPSLIRSKKYNAIVCAMAQRRPNIAPLWLGSLITGLLPRILQLCRSYLPTVYLEAVTWTGSPQSFMDPQYHRLAPVQKIDGVQLIPREDEFRLLFITDVDSQTYRNPLLSPYRPFGYVDLRNISIDVRLHYSCNHQLRYYCWNWKCEEGQVSIDFGMSYGLKAVESSMEPNTLRSTDLDKEEIFDDTLSELATRNIFSWTSFSEGTRSEERELWKHEWLELLVDRNDGAESSESSPSEVEDVANSEQLQHVQKWRDNVVAE
ncbi:hypothetical protein AO1008_02659 [Aspergillus oryzae 100-8]|uniref:Uncharacterized protein n=1 Tax=Aspergillus oryzae (strain 3.042) TaxID=1160506 RepID=I8AB70_ASPO3|nr:hypothetical protein Ao3042_00548 [Aspergillus oryzae 3.042]KDE76754.1 hypothetical protein AO1008_02659 [Aspergillus oryzae 100-8]|eukprot:EIT82309.1 hypothetical protein Ao3042_00548 [Aspergillus oryzae 3.042]